MTAWWGGGDGDDSGSQWLFVSPQVALMEENLKMSRREETKGHDCLRFYCSD